MSSRDSYAADLLLSELENGCYRLSLGSDYPEKFDPDGAMKVIIEALRAFGGPSREQIIEAFETVLLYCDVNPEGETGFERAVLEGRRILKQSRATSGGPIPGQQVP